ncbi:MAG: serine hydrolase [Bacteroidetes bacterium]|nr:serine hydrolase [Bacteroidota bacterium]
MKSITRNIILPWTVISLLLFFAIPAQCQQTSSDRSQTIDRLLTAYHKLNRFSGVVLIAQQGSIILSKGYGYANIEWQIPNSPETKYLLASISKIFTATLIMQLIDQGKLTPDTKLADVLHWYSKEIGEQVTIRQLLNHTSGIPDYMDFQTQTYNQLSMEFGASEIDKLGFATRYCSGKLEFEPGTHWKYSNSGYFLLGLVVESLYYKQFHEVLKEMIFDPLKMTGSGDLHPYPDRVVYKLATGYIRTENGFSHSPYWNMSTAFGVGSLYSTTEDLLKFDQAFYTNTLISDKSKEAMFTSGLNGYGFGWELSEMPIGPQLEMRKTETNEDSLWAWHTSCNRIPQDKFLIVMISNSGDAPFTKMFAGITDILYNRTPVFPKALLCETVAGKYKMDGIAKAIEYGKKLLADNPDSLEMSESEMNGLGYYFLLSARKKEAVQIFRWNTELFPTSTDVWNGYGKSLAETGNYDEAVKAYRQSLKLNPKNNPGEDLLKKLQEP